ncbi:MAG: TAXI family TRAP transporter solute-binding subunit, partial [Candidatus Methylomirabilales bacterium]
MKKVLAPALAVVVAVGTAGLLESAQARKLLVIGGGAETGVYYQVAVNVCKLVNEKLGGQGYDCKGQPALGSVVNIKAMSQGYLDFAVVQSDHNGQAYNGEENWKGKPVKA